MSSSEPSRTRNEADVRVAPPAPPASPPTSAPSRATASVTAPASRPRAAARGMPAVSSGRLAALARRKAMSSRGKVAAGNKDRVRDGQRMRPAVEAAPAAAAGKGDGCGCGCKGNGERREAAAPAQDANSSRPNGRAKVRGPRRRDVQLNPGRAASLVRRRAQSSRGKVGMSASGMSVAQTARATNPELSGRELAKALREQRSRRAVLARRNRPPADVLAGRGPRPPQARPRMRPGKSG
jgi:hypothetical protein